MNTEDPEHIVAGDIYGDGNDELAVSFVGWGLCSHEPEGAIWELNNTGIPDGMNRYGNGVAVDFGATYGFWVWSQGGEWKQRHTVDLGRMTAVNIHNDGVQELVVSLNPYLLMCFAQTPIWALELAT